MQKSGVVEIESYGLALRCSVCGKTLCYKIGSGVTTTAWDDLKRAFCKLHNAKCGKGD